MKSTRLILFHGFIFIDGLLLLFFVCWVFFQQWKSLIKSTQIDAKQNLEPVVLTVLVSKRIQRYFIFKKTLHKDMPRENATLHWKTCFCAAHLFPRDYQSPVLYWPGSICAQSSKGGNQGCGGRRERKASPSTWKIKTSPKDGTNTIIFPYESCVFANDDAKHRNWNQYVMTSDCTRGFAINFGVRRRYRS